MVDGGGARRNETKARTRQHVKKRKAKKQKSKNKNKTNALREERVREFLARVQHLLVHALHEAALELDGEAHVGRRRGHLLRQQLQLRVEIRQAVVHQQAHEVEPKHLGLVGRRRQSRLGVEGAQLREVAAERRVVARLDRVHHERLQRRHRRRDFAGPAVAAAAACRSAELDEQQLNLLHHRRCRIEGAAGDERLQLLRRGLALRDHRHCGVRVDGTHKAGRDTAGPSEPAGLRCVCSAGTPEGAIKSEAARRLSRHGKKQNRCSQELPTYFANKLRSDRFLKIIVPKIFTLIIL